MEVKVCKNCRRLFNYVYGPELCPDCSKIVSKENEISAGKETAFMLRPLGREEEDKFEKVKDYILAHPRASIVQIAEANDMLPTKLLDWVREDRLAFSDESANAWFTCEKCGAKIKSGRFCCRCKPR